MVKLALFFLLIFQIKYSLAALTCAQYLISSDPSFHRQDLFHSTMDNYISEQFRIYDVQQRWVSQLKLRLKERSLPIRNPAFNLIPQIKPETIALLTQLQKTNLNSIEYFALLAEILNDPYLKWLDQNWVDNRLDLFKVFHSELNETPGTPWNSVEKLEAVSSNITDYIKQHSYYLGFMQLPPEILIFRIMRDHDPFLTQEDKYLITNILSMQRYIFLLTQLIYEFGNHSFGRPEEWNNITTIKVALSEFQAIKEKVRLLFPDEQMSDFLKKQISDMVNPSISFEDFLVYGYLFHSTSPTDVDLYERYTLLKRIINFGLISQNPDLLDEYFYNLIQANAVSFLY